MKNYKVRITILAVFLLILLNSNIFAKNESENQCNNIYTIQNDNKQKSKCIENYENKFSDKYNNNHLINSEKNSEVKFANNINSNNKINKDKFIERENKITTVSEIKIASSTTNEEDLEESNNFLKSLKVLEHNITPEFNKYTLNYYCLIENSTNSLEIDAVAETDLSTVKITGNKSLTKEENTINITVTSKKGTKKTYTIIAKKQKDNGLKLESLNIGEETLEPVFSENIFSYNVNIKTKQINPLNIEAIPNQENAKVEILGNDNNLTFGENIITIVLTNNDNTTIYQLNVNIYKHNEKQVVNYTNERKYNFIYNLITNIQVKILDFFSNEEKTIYFLIGIAGFLLLLIIIFLIKIIRQHKIKKNKEKIKNRAK